MSDYHKREQQRQRDNAARSAERRAALEQRQAERAARTGTTTAPRAGLNYHTAMHAIGLRSPVPDSHRHAALAILDGLSPAEFAAQLAGTAPTVPSMASATAASKRADSVWLTEADRAQRRSFDNPRGD